MALYIINKSRPIPENFDPVAALCASMLKNDPGTHGSIISMRESMYEYALHGVRYVPLYEATAQIIRGKREIDMELLRGGVEWNPGPLYPCGGCGNAVVNG